MKPEWYKIIQRAVEVGAAYGVNRSYKHNDTPSRDDITDSVIREVMNEMCEWIDFGDPAVVGG